MRYLHTMVRVKDLDASLHFYTTLLGLKEVRRIENEKGRFTLVFLAASDDIDQANATQAPCLELTYNWIAFLATDGFEDSELTSPWQAVTEAGGSPVMIAPASDPITGKNGHEQPVDATSGDVDASDFDALVLPGGVVNADHLRLDEAAVRFTRDFFAQHKPVAAICHAAWILAEAEVLDGRTLTSYPSLRTDLTNAGATWVDEEVVVDEGLVSSRTPDDLPAFNAKLVEEISEGKHDGQTT